MTKRTKRRAWTLTVIASIGIVATLTGVHFGAAHAQTTEPLAATTQPTEEAKPVASVTTAPIRTGDISENIIAYGNVTAQPGEVTIYSVPIECRVKHIRVTPGQNVEKAALLVEVEPSPDAQLQLLEARNTLDAAEKDMKQTQQRFDLKLATNQELQQSQQNLQTAKVRLENMSKRGAGEDVTRISAENAGLVSKIDVQEGQIVPAGGPLVEMVSQDRIEVKLGIEPSDIDKLQEGQAVSLTPVSDTDATPLKGKIRLITHRLNPETRLVDVFVSLESHESLLLDAAVRAEVISPPKQAMIVPHSAVLPDDDGLTLFTVKDGHAVKHTVKIGLHNDREVEVIADGLNAGDSAVILGNLELEDGTAVSTETTR